MAEPTSPPSALPPRAPSSNVREIAANPDAEKPSNVAVKEWRKHRQAHGLMVIIRSHFKSIYLIPMTIVSLVLGRAVRRRVAMTGEITLRGEILPIGGVKEKVLAAHAAGVETVLLPRANERDLREVPPAVRRGLRFRFVDHMEELLEIALVPSEQATGPAA